MVNWNNRFEIFQNKQKNNKMAAQEQNPTIHDRLADLTGTMQREKIEFSPEMKKYFDERLAQFTEQMTKGKMPIKKELDEFIEKLKNWMKMSKKFREKYPSIEAMDARSLELITKMKLEENYDEMTDTLQNYGYTDKIPDWQTVMKAIMNLGPEMLKRIKKFNRPTILMTPKGDLASKIQKLDSNKKYKDENGEPIPGVTVVVKGTTRGVLTGIDGNYQINLTEGGKILFKHGVHGYPRKVRPFIYPPVFQFRQKFGGLNADVMILQRPPVGPVRYGFSFLFM